MTTISVSDLSSPLSKAGMVQPVQLIDVCSPGEFASGRNPGAVNLPMEQIEARLDGLLTNMPIVLVCHAGKPARMAAGLLEPRRTDVTVLDGGTAACSAAGLPLVVRSKVPPAWISSGSSSTFQAPSTPSTSPASSVPSTST